MGARGILLPACLLAGCLSAPGEGGASKDGGPAGDGGAAAETCDPIPLEDVFDGADWVDERWAESWEDAAGMLEAVNDRAAIHPTGVADEYAYFETTSSYDFEGRCVHVEVPTMLTYGDAFDSEALMGVALVDDFWITVGQQQGTVCCAIDDGDVTVDEACDVEYSPELHRWWRIRFREGGVSCDVSADKSAWQVVGDFTRDVGIQTGRVDLYAGTWNDVEVPGDVEFDNLNL